MFDNNNTKALVEALSQEDPNIKIDKFGARPLHFFCQFSNAQDVIESLIARGADVSITDNFGRTAAFMVNDNSVSNLDILHRHSLNLNHQDSGVNSQPSSGVTCLCNAIMLEQVKVVEKLIRLGVDVNIQSSDGRTAFHYFLDNFSFNAGGDNTFYEKTFGLLVNGGADLSIKNHEGKSVRDMIVAQGYHLVLQEKAYRFLAGSDLNLGANGSPSPVAILNQDMLETIVHNLMGDNSLVR